MVMKLQAIVGNIKIRTSKRYLRCDKIILRHSIVITTQPADFTTQRRSNVHHYSIVSIPTNLQTVS